MEGFASSLRHWLWIVSVAAQLTVLGVLFFKGHLRRLPAFGTYIALDLCEAGSLFYIDNRFGFSSPEYSHAFFMADTITLIARVLATCEILRLTLGQYRGIWTLAWRLLVVTFLAVLSYTMVRSFEDKTWAVVTADRGFNLAFAVALVACLLLIRYYSIPVETLFRTLLAGFCFYACAHVLKDTFVQAIFLHYRNRFHPYQELWDSTALLPFIIVLVVWANALRKPALAAHKQPVLLPVSVYQQVSPEVNLRLRLLNERLSRFWKVEATRP